MLKNIGENKWHLGVFGKISFSEKKFKRNFSKNLIFLKGKG
jgi:hypothetical protein